MLSNAFTAFRRLIPNAPLEVGNVVAVAGDVATIELPGGGRVNARGVATIGDRVFVRDGVIEGAAPTLSYIAAEV